jgi:two-component system, chemotaxis family, response regulator Rcp1
MEVLLVEDNENDVLLTRECFKLAGLNLTLHHVWNGKECMEFLRKRGTYAAAPTPDLILCDLNMPIIDGRDVLRQIAADESLNHLPVIILTTSTARQDILDMYKLRCNSYIVKPIDFAEFRHVIDELQKYWFNLVALPSPKS